MEELQSQMLISALAAAYVDWVIKQVSHENEPEINGFAVAASYSGQNEFTPDTGSLYGRARRGKDRLAGAKNAGAGNYVGISIQRSI